jgi:4-hydroxymandelate oxidase
MQTGPANPTPGIRSWPGANDSPFATLAEVFEAGRGRLDPDIRAFLEGGAGEEETLTDNRRAFAAWRFRPRVLTGQAAPDPRTRFLGIPLAMPVLTAPFGADRLFDPDGHLAVARANARFGTASIVPEASSFSLQAVAAAAPAAARILQLHPAGSAEHFREMIARARDAGYDALCITADCPTAGWREHMMRSRWMPPAEMVSGNYPEAGGVIPWDIFGQLVPLNEPPWSWRKLADLCGGPAGMKFMVKGILTAEDAHAAREAGAAAVLVSNHGGRQLDGAPATLDQLPEIRDALGTGFPIAFDGGVRRATDIIKALALGADVVVIGRAAALGLAAAGENGVFRVLELLHAELVTTMTLLGVPDIAAIGHRCVQAARR